ncbi:MAG: PspC domain-containing protein [Chloroflexi bacterium]|nr:PspC domain-containing protein [Chloroflexota bacterium]
MQKRLYRSRKDVILGGVCSGLGDYFGLDPAIFRILFVLFAVAGGPGVLVYIVLWIILPLEGETDSAGAFDGQEFSSRARQMGQELGQAVRQPNQRGLRYLGIGLLLAGGWLFLQALDLPWLEWANTRLLWPLTLVMIGVVMLTRAFHGEE